MKRAVGVIALSLGLAVSAEAARLVVKDPGKAPRHVEIGRRLCSEAARSAANDLGMAERDVEYDSRGRAKLAGSKLVPPNSGDVYWLQTGIDYGVQLTSPLCYGNTRHVCRQAIVDVPWVVYETGESADNEVYYSYWEDLFWAFSSPESLSSSGDDAGRVSIVTDPLGTVHAAWHQSDDYSLDPHEVFYARRPLGGTWSSPVQLSPEDLKSSVFPAIDVDALGNPWVVWMDRTDLQTILHGLYATYSTDGGLSWDPGTVHRISDVDTTVDIPAMAADPINGDVWVAYEEDEWDPSDVFADIAVYHYTPGTGWDAGTIVAYSDTTLGEPGSKPNMEPTLVVDGGGVCHVMFQANRYTDFQPGFGTYDANVYLWMGNVCRVHNAAGTWSEPRVLWPRDRDRVGDRTGSWMGIGVVGADVEGNLYCSCNAYVYADTTYLYGPYKEAVVGQLATGGSVWRWKNVSRINARGDSTYAKYVQLPQETPSDGADVVWDEALEGGEQPFDVLYAHADDDFCPPAPVSNFAAASAVAGGAVAVSLTWSNPLNPDWVGTELYRAQEEAPQLVGFGVLMPPEAEPIYFGTASEYVDSSVVLGETWCYTAVAWDEVGNFSESMSCSLTVGSIVLCGGIDGGNLVLLWSTLAGASSYWVYGAADTAHFLPGFAPGYEHRLAVLLPPLRPWPTGNGVGDPDSNWTYLVIAVAAGEQEVGRSNRFGEHDFGMGIAR